MAHLDAVLRILFYCVALSAAIRYKYWRGYVISLILIVGIGSSYFTPIASNSDLQEFVRDVIALAVMNYIISTSKENE